MTKEEELKEEPPRCMICDKALRKRNKSSFCNLHYHKHHKNWKVRRLKYLDEGKRERNTEVKQAIEELMSSGSNFEVGSKILSDYNTALKELLQKLGLGEDYGK